MERRSGEILHCCVPLLRGFYSRLPEPSEYCLFMCNLIFPLAQRLRAGSRRNWLEGGRQGDALSLNRSFIC